MTSIRHFLTIAAVIASFVLLAPLSANAAETKASDLENTLFLDTVYGRVVIKLRPDLAPNHVKRIKKLTREGFYDGLKFHRVIDGFMAQTGDPKGNGTGGSNLPDLKAEFSPRPFEKGVVGMARSQDPDSANSQFFIMFASSSWLNGQYTVWGEVASGMEFVNKIKKGEPPVNPDIIVKMQVAADAK
ncbi:peptidylprolyl isomerase [Cohaesibacter celericrescens]|uniref:Peptidyl-prolyl cis-trans isomerase n=1 Tax=Cohaesibacter celericrescens TaxID=2067669 RepID=A0A2N5XT30_9HYPH|nr:peptidylprolyl isomerase [Cohaesibacter celericrescens]PLW77649.1 peptidylprolyl isomerase [Cohaesibacter celericrescens]